MADHKALLHITQPYIEQIELTMRNDLDELAVSMDSFLIEILEYGLFSGGKRFRPLLAVLAGRLCGCENLSLYKVAIAFEYLHLATLFHDDVIDVADTRRGKPSVCKKYGNAAAILAGDFLHARSMWLVDTFGKTGSLQVFCKATAGMVDGEFTQLRNSFNFNQSEADYFRAIEGKTALLISATTEIGALQGEAQTKEIEALREYGKHLGYGFQIIDDLLDYQGDQDKTGKLIGNDLVEGKMTLPLILTLEKATDNDFQELQAILQDTKLRSTSFQAIRDLINKYDGFQRSRAKAESAIGNALEYLDIFSDSRIQDVEALKGLANFTLAREN